MTKQIHKNALTKFETRSYVFVAERIVLQAFYYVCRYSFKAELQGSAPIQAVWFKDGIPITSPDYEQKFENNLASLSIDETFSEDTAVYTIQASNPYGQVTSSAKLVVKGQHHSIGKIAESIVFVASCFLSFMTLQVYVFWLIIASIQPIRWRLLTQTLTHTCTCTCNIHLHLVCWIGKTQSDIMQVSRRNVY